MALIGEIRKRSWLLIVLIGFAMAGFVFMDMFSGPRSAFGGGQLDIGEVNGATIDQRNFERAYSALYSNSAGDVFQQRDQLWNYMVEEEVVRQEAEATGLGVSDEELEDLQYGTELSPIVQARFRDQQTGQVNREGLNSFRDAERNGIMNDPTQVDPQRASFWRFQKTEIKKQRVQDKLSTLVAKSMYTPDWMAEEMAKGQNTRVDIAYVTVPYDNIPDDAVTVTEQDYEAFLTTEGARFARKTPGRALSYVAFAVAPTDADSTTLRDKLTEVAQRWGNAPSDSLFVTQQRGQFPGTYFATDDLPEAIRDAEVGSIVGPYLDADRFSVSKIVDRMTVPDSVRSRHILLPAATPEEYARTQSLADSLETLISDGTNTFDELARQFSTGPTSTKGGDLGYVAPGAMVGPFNDLIFYKAKEGEVNQVLTQFGLHLVEVTGVRSTSNTQGTRVATISEAIEPSNKTQKDVYEVAARFAQANRTAAEMATAAAALPNATFVENTVVGPNDYVLGNLGSGNSARDIVKWAFKNDEGDVSPNVYAFKQLGRFFDGNYVVAAVTGELSPGIPSGPAARGLVKREVLNMKKAELVGGAGADIAAVASKYGVEADTARAINFNSAFVPGLGNEPRAVAQAFSLPLNQTSEAIAGQAGVIMVRPLVRTEPGDVSANVANVRRAQDSRVTGNVRNRFGLALRESAEIEDDRPRFY